MVIPEANKVASKSASPVHEAVPSSSCDVLGPGAFKTFPVLKITPFCNGKFGFVFSKYPIPLTLPNDVPVRQLMLEIETQSLSTKTSVTSCGTV